MPAFNTNLLKLGGNTPLVSEQLYHANLESQTLLDEMTKLDNLRKNQSKQLKRFTKKLASAKKEGAKPEKEDLDQAENVRTEDANQNKTNLLLFSRQIDQLYSSLQEVDQVLPNDLLTKVETQ